MKNYTVRHYSSEYFELWNAFSFPITEKIHNEVLSLPISPVMTNEEVNIVIQKVNQY